MTVLDADTANTNDLLLLRGLLELYLNRCHSFTDQICTTLARNNPLLQVLCIQNAGSPHTDTNRVTDRALHAFLEHCPLLHSVEFMYSVRTDSQYNANPNTTSLLRTLIRKQYPHVKHFECNFSKLSIYCRWVGE